MNAVRCPSTIEKDDEQVQCVEPVDGHPFVLDGKATRSCRGWSKDGTLCLWTTPKEES